MASLVSDGNSSKGNARGGNAPYEYLCRRRAWWRRENGRCGYRVMGRDLERCEERLDIFHL